MSLVILANASAATESLQNDLSPVLSALVGIAGTLAVLLLVVAGFYYMSSRGRPEKLERAKKTLKNTAIGLVIVLAASGIVGFMQSAYQDKPVETLDVRQDVEPVQTDSECVLCQVINDSISSFVQGVLQSVGKPIVDGLKQFTTATPLVGQNASVFNVWLVVLAITNVLFVLVVTMIGFRFMSASVLGLEEEDLRTLLPQILAVFGLVNVSIFVIDAIIMVSNAMISALVYGMENEVIWTALGGLITATATVNIGILLFIAVAIILAVMLLVYYLKRIIVLYIGAVLSPLIILLWLLPSFRDFSVSAGKMYLTTIFVLFVQVVVLMLSVSLFSGLLEGEGNPFMTALLSIATLSVLLSTSRTMNYLTMAGASGYGFRRLGSTFVRGASHIAGSVKYAQGGSGYRTAYAGAQDDTMKPRSAFPHTTLLQANKVAARPEVGVDQSASRAANSSTKPTHSSVRKKKGKN